MTDWKTSAERWLEQPNDDDVRLVLNGGVNGRWHPNGFAIFILGKVANLGYLRLHVWPKGVRRPVDGHPPIHCHDWELCSRVLIGHYNDTLYELAPAPQASQYIVHSLEHTTTGENITSGGPIALRVADRRLIRRGETHHMDPGQLHETDIPPDSGTATLLLMSPRRPVQTVLVGERPFNVAAHQRPLLSQMEMAAVRALLVDAQLEG